MNTIVQESPVGLLTLTSDGERLVSIWFDDHQFPTRVDAQRAQGRGAEDSVLRRARKELDEYFSGKRQRFEVPLAARGGTNFQRSVWLALAAIPYGTTVTYGEIARRIGAPTSVRAVGGAVGANPLSIVVPCHRVIGANGTLTGFGGGLDRKKYLLGLEGYSGTRP